jgi:hypothetical protein
MKWLLNTVANSVLEHAVDLFLDYPSWKSFPVPPESMLVKLVSVAIVAFVGTVKAVAFVAMVLHDW